MDWEFGASMLDNRTKFLFLLLLQAAVWWFNGSSSYEWVSSVNTSSQISKISRGNPTQKQAMYSPFADEYWNVSYIEVGTLEKTTQQASSWRCQKRQA